MFFSVNSGYQMRICLTVICLAPVSMDIITMLPTLSKSRSIFRNPNLGHPGGLWYTTPHAPCPGHEKPRKIKEKR